jgi:N-acetylglutamate synthase-like GNAT family acetyltransferase
MGHKELARWMMEEDLPEVRRMRKDCGLRGDIEDLVESPDFICKVADISGSAVGFIAYKNSRDRVRIKEVATSPDLADSRVGDFIMESVVGSCDSGRKFVEVMVSENDLRSQKFFRDAGFRAAEIVAESFGTFYRFERPGAV